MADDIFSRLFELFDQPGPINWKLAEEIARHLAGEADAVDPWAADEIEQLVRLAEFRLEGAAPFAASPAPQVRVVDGRTWVDESLRRLAYLADPITEAVTAAYPAITAGPGIGGTIAGLQIGSIAGTIAAANVASFEAGIPLLPAEALLVIGPAVERLMRSGDDEHQARLWVAAHEVAHRALFSVPWLPEHLGSLLGRSFAAIMPTPEKFGDLLSQDPSAMADPEKIAALFDRPPSEAEAELEAFLALTGGYRRVIVDRTMGEMLVAEFTSIEEETSGPGSALPRAADLVPRGFEFCGQVERRFGREALDSLWDGPERLPTAAELDDPVGWAARVLLDTDF
jgi:putative hydrolase